MTYSCHEGAPCFYCDGLLAGRHEHDHMPVPKRHGGEETVAICINCHDLKDRTALKNWPAGALFVGWSGMTPIGRMLLARVYALSLDIDAEVALRMKQSA